jgi:hypothetical protein
MARWRLSILAPAASGRPPCDALADSHQKASDRQVPLAAASPDWLDLLLNWGLGVLVVLAYVGLVLLQAFLEQ